jgi:site-specific DNA recombinase
MQKLIADIGKLDLVLVYKLDRLSRSQKDTLHLIEDVFLKNNVDFVSMNESFDTSTPFGRAMIGILSVFAQLERETIKERSLMGRTERAKEGLFHGGHAPIGYDYTDGQLVINEYEAMQVREVYRLHLEGKSTEAITKHMAAYRHKYGGWHYASTIGNVLTNCLYAGLVEFHGIRYKGQHPAIIDVDVYKQAQAIIARRQGHQAFESKYLLSGLIWCGNCGARYFVRNSAGGRRYYSCYSRAKMHEHMIKDPDCQNRNIRVDELDDYITARVLELAFDPEAILRVIAGPQEAAAESDSASIITRKLGDIDKQISRLMDLYQIESIPAEEIGRRVERLYAERKELQGQLPSLEAKPEMDLSGIRELLGDIPQVWELATNEERRGILRRLIRRIDIFEDDIKIEWCLE